MKLVTYQDPSGTNRVGIRVHTDHKNTGDGQIIHFSDAFDIIKSQGLAPSTVEHASTLDMLEFIRNQEQALPAARAVASAWNEGRLPESVSTPEEQVDILSPIPRPTSMRDAYAFRQHVEAARRNRGVEMIPEFDEFPVFYFTNHQAVSGPGVVRVEERHLDRLDFELEYAIVVGKEGRNIPASRADDYIFGFCIMNDLSARALQMQEMKMSLGPAKGKDFSTTLGPYLVPKSELEGRSIPGEQGQRHDLSMKCWVNGQQVSEGNSKDMSWTFAQILERVSYGVTIYPGDVVGSGTVGTGCFLELNGSKITDNQWLQDGDQVKMEIDELGVLINTIEKT